MLKTNNIHIHSFTFNNADYVNLFYTITQIQAKLIKNFTFNECLWDTRTPKTFSWGKTLNQIVRLLLFIATVHSSIKIVLLNCSLVSKQQVEYTTRSTRFLIETFWQNLVFIFRHPRIWQTVLMVLVVYVRPSSLFMLADVIPLSSLNKPSIKFSWRSVTFVFLASLVTDDKFATEAVLLNLTNKFH